MVRYGRVGNIRRATPTFRLAPRTYIPPQQPLAIRLATFTSLR